MATIKSFTDIEQSTALSKILPHESADMWWAALNWQEIEYYVEIKQDGFNQPKKAIPCWSLAALLSILPKGTNISTPKPINELGYCCWNQHDEIYADNPVDACVAMIELLHEQKLL